MHMVTLNLLRLTVKKMRHAKEAVQEALTIRFILSTHLVPRFLKTKKASNVPYV